MDRTILALILLFNVFIYDVYAIDDNKCLINYEIQSKSNGKDSDGESYDNQYISSVNEIACESDTYLDINTKGVALDNEGYILVYSDEKVLVKNNENIIYNVRYDRARFDLIYEENGGNEIHDLNNIKYESLVTISDGPNKAGEKFLYWLNDNGEIYYPKMNIDMTSNDIYLTAIYNETPTTFFVNHHYLDKNGVILTTNTNSYNAKDGDNIYYSELLIQKYEGYEIKVPDEELLLNINNNQVNEINFYYQEVSAEYDLYLNDENIETLKVNETYILPKLELEGYELLYWYYYNEQDQKFLVLNDNNNDFILKMPAHDVKLYAELKTINKEEDISPTSTPFFTKEPIINSTEIPNVGDSEDNNLGYLSLSAIFLVVLNSTISLVAVIKNKRILNKINILLLAFLSILYFILVNNFSGELILVNMITIPLFVITIIQVLLYKLNL